jgi:hypothetical protein
MATIQPIVDLTVSRPSRWAVWFGRFEAWLERVADRFNPILVKECRQALKSRQFTITFALVLGCCWLWSIYGVMMVGPGVHFSTGSAGLRMFSGYFAIMAFPLLVVVPHGAFRSLADERDDRTFELLSITALGPRQIVAGKLGSAVVQMLVYLSAITPCLAFTYLLRGIEAPTIMILVVYMFFGSLGLSMVALLAATLAQERHWQTLWSAAVVLGLVMLFFFVVGAGTEGITRERIPFESPGFWYANVGMALTYSSYFALFLLAAAARLTFPSENRSTPLRIVMLVQQLLLTFGVAWGIAYQRTISDGFRDMAVFGILSMFVSVLPLHWYFMGLFMIGEMPRLSNRAKRRLPQSFLGRAFFTWFNPGPASGYVFAVTNLASGMMLVLGAIAVWAGSQTSPQVTTPNPTRFGSSSNDIWQIVYICLLAFGYVAFYLGLGRLVLGLLRRVAPVGMFLGVLIQVLLLLIGCIAPVLIDELAGNHRYEYSLLYVYNPPATFGAVGRQMLTGGSETAVLIVLCSALAMFLANLRGIAEELRQVRAEAPRRVIEEEEALHPKPVMVPINPFE